MSTYRIGHAFINNVEVEAYWEKDSNNRYILAEQYLFVMSEYGITKDITDCFYEYSLDRETINLAIKQCFKNSIEAQLYE